MTRATLYGLLPLCLLLALFLVWQGVPQTFAHYVNAVTMQGTDQVIPLGPAASQIAIKQLGTNGGGFFGVNSAHPFENPTAWSNLFELVSIILIPVRWCSPSAITSRTCARAARSSPACWRCS
jgi:K+-transporting ATPase ATPase A chain